MIYRVAPQPSARARVRSDLMSAQSPRSAAAIRMVRASAPAPRMAVARCPPGLMWEFRLCTIGLYYWILSPSRLHVLRHRCGEVVGVDPVLAAAIMMRPDIHPDIDCTANTLT